MRTVQGCPFKCIDEYRCEQLPSYQEDLEDLRKENQELQEQVCDVCEDVSPPVAFRIAMSCATVKPQVGLNVWVFFLVPGEPARVSDCEYGGRFPDAASGGSLSHVLCSLASIPAKGPSWPPQAVCGSALHGAPAKDLRRLTLSLFWDVFTGVNESAKLDEAARKQDGGTRTAAAGGINGLCFCG